MAGIRQVAVYPPPHSLPARHLQPGSRCPANPCQPLPTPANPCQPLSAPAKPCQPLSAPANPKRNHGALTPTMCTSRQSASLLLRSGLATPSPAPPAAPPSCETVARSCATPKPTGPLANQVLTKPELPSLSNSKGEAQPGRPGGILNLSRRLGAMHSKVIGAEKQHQLPAIASADGCGEPTHEPYGAHASCPELPPFLIRTKRGVVRQHSGHVQLGRTNLAPHAGPPPHADARSEIGAEEFAQLSRNLDAASGTPTGSTLYQRLQLSRSSCTLTGLEDAVAKLARSSVVPPGTPQGLSHSAEPSPSEPGPRGSWYGEAAVRGGGASPSSAAAAARAALGLAAEEAAEGVLRPQPPPTALVDMGGAARRRSSLVLAAGLEQQEWAGVCPSPGGAAASWRPGGQGSPLPQVAGPR
ncbi:hypothetical protein HaLaN_11876 [Haematococcus lacustris]|uniref:Uncharacterized protein n=1 Tax=Haematococcus lacustris TaxID=44745 RepID=A0A699ZIU4_HAELA|nr:hypothetical protein HaLaN_11876 [Haematococcus lacustris]